MPRASRHRPPTPPIAGDSVNATLDSEIALLRARIHTLAELTAPDRKPSAQLYGLLMRAIDSLARALRVQAHIQPPSDPLAGVSEQALRELEAE